MSLLLEDKHRCRVAGLTRIGVVPELGPRQAVCHLAPTRASHNALPAITRAFRAFLHVPSASACHIPTLYQRIEQLSLRQSALLLLLFAALNLVHIPFLPARIHQRIQALLLREEEHGIVGIDV